MEILETYRGSEIRHHQVLIQDVVCAHFPEGFEETYYSMQQRLVTYFKRRPSGIYGGNVDTGRCDEDGQAVVSSYFGWQPESLRRAQIDYLTSAFKYCIDALWEDASKRV